MYKILNKCSLGDIKSVLSKTLLFFFSFTKNQTFNDSYVQSILYYWIGLMSESINYMGKYRV